MKRLILILMTCVVVDQLKSENGWTTKCRGNYVDGQVIFTDEVPVGRIVGYKPFIVPDDEIIHGRIFEINDPKGPKPPEAAPDGAGKPPNEL